MANPELIADIKKRIAELEKEPPGETHTWRAPPEFKLKLLRARLAELEAEQAKEAEESK